MSIRQTISVTAEDIAHGKAKNCLECPIALAARRAMAGVGKVVTASVGREFMSVLYNVEENRSLNAILPARAKTFVDKFDAGLDVKPFQFLVKLQDALEYS